MVIELVGLGKGPILVGLGDDEPAQGVVIAGRLTVWIAVAVAGQPV